MEEQGLNTFNGILPDGGPLYAETNLSYFIAEPWNAISSLAFLLPVIYYLIKLRGQYKEHLFLTFCLPLLFFGGLGSTLYHAFRASPFLLMMDVLPIVILTLAVSIYFWLKVFPKWWYVFFVLCPYLLIRFFPHVAGPMPFGVEYSVSMHHFINLTYFLTGVMIFLPALIFLVRSKFYAVHIIVIACLLLMLSLFFREIDAWEEAFLPMGTHWLWHAFSAIGAGLLGEYLYLNRKRELFNNG